MLANLNDVLLPAMRSGYAVGLFNTIDTDMLQAVVSAAEALGAPVVIGTAEILLPYGDLPLIAPSLLACAARSSVPVCLHYDHGLTFSRCMQALKLGFTSVMYDGSAKPYAQNAEETREITRVAHAMGATVEGEIGHVGSADDPAEITEDQYTTPEEAARYLADTGVDALAVAIGTAHGAYRRKPALSMRRLAQLREAVNAPLVLHGGSGLSDDDFRNAIRRGISKVNIFTDLCLAGAAAQASALQKGLDYLETRNAKVAAIRECVTEKIRLFGCEGKA